MLFNSFEYLFFFLPLALGGYFALQRFSIFALAWLTLASLFFYAWWNPWHLPIIAGSIVFNFKIGQLIQNSLRYKRVWLVLGIVANLGMLGWYKYTYFFANLAGLNDAIPIIVLPLGISFFTFTQIAYLVDTARGQVHEIHPLHYALFVTFFPHLLAGPILHHREMMPQFANLQNRIFNGENFARGLYLLAIGLGKKVLIADSLAEQADAGFASPAMLSFEKAWLTTLSYTFQIYFDFSGYTDMALGAAWMFNIRLPANFNSPYLATDIRSFWQRWHMTLSRFLRDYVYIPLGGNRGSEANVWGAIFATFLLGGFWHGAGWTFIIWGVLHAAAMISLRIWRRIGFPLHWLPAWLITLLFVHLTWVFFRATSVQDAITILRALIPDRSFLQKTVFIAEFGNLFKGLPYTAPSVWIIIIIAFALVLVPRNSTYLAENFKAHTRECLFTITVFVMSTLSLGHITKFLYFNF